MNEVQSAIKALRHNDEHVRSQAALRLGTLGDPQAIDPLVATLCHDPSLNVQEDTTWALARLGATVVDALLPWLEKPQGSVRHNIVHTLGKLGDARAVPALMLHLNDSEANVRMKSAFALGQIGDPSAVPALIDSLDDADSDVHYTALEAIAQFGSKAIPALRAGLTAEDAQVREGCAAALGRLGDPDTVSDLVIALDDPTHEVRLAVGQALGEIGGPEAAAALQALTEDGHPQIQALARGLLRRI